MSFSKNPGAYSVALLELFEKSMLAPSAFVIPCGDRKKAKYVQMRLHAVKYAIQHTKTHPLHNDPTMLTKQIVINDKFDVVVQSSQESKEAEFFNSILDEVLEHNKKVIAATDPQLRPMVGVGVEDSEGTPLEKITRSALKAKEKLAPKVTSNNDLFIPPVEE